MQSYLLKIKEPETTRVKNRVFARKEFVSSRELCWRQILDLSPEAVLVMSANRVKVVSADRS